jgi:alanine-synthesizing transaminase
MASIHVSHHLEGVRYEIRGPLARRADELERAGHTILKLNIGNPGAFGFRTPEAIRLAILENLAKSEGYCHQKGILPAREAIAADFRLRGLSDVVSDHVFVGNGASELISLVLRALVDDGDEVLVPSPDYPLWTAAVTLNGAKAVHYDCPEDTGWVPRVDEVRALITPKTRALVVISPNNPTGAVYPKATLQGLASLADEHDLVLLSDEIYDHILYEGAVHHPIGTLSKQALVGTFGGLSKVHRACGFRVGWVGFSGALERARDFLLGVDLLCALRLCSNVPGQWAVPAALGGANTIDALTSRGGRLYETRRAVIEGCGRSKYLYGTAPMGALYAFLGVRGIAGFDDRRFALDLLEKKQVLVAPGDGFNVPYRDHFRITLLPDADTMAEVFRRMEDLLDGV